MNVIALVIFALAASAAVIAPIVQQRRRPWSIDEPSGEAEALRQEELATLEALRDLAMDYKLNNLNATDYRVLTDPLQQRAKQVQTLKAQHQMQSIATLPVVPGLAQSLEAEIQAARRTTDGGGERGVAVAEPAPGEVAGVRYCPQCGTEADPSARFCTECGTALKPANPATNGATQSTINGHATTNGTAKTVPNIAPKSKPPKVAAPTAAPARRGLNRRVLLGGTAVIALVWVAIVAGVYLQGRGSQTARTPVLSFDAPVQMLKQVNGQVLLSSGTETQLSDDGATWTDIDLDGPVLSATALGAGWLVSTEDGLWQSDDGLAWASLTMEQSFIGLASAPRMGLVWGVTPDALYQSSDAGATWELLSDALPGRAQAFAVGPGVLFLGTDDGVFSSSDGGQGWSNRSGIVNGRIENLNIHSLSFDGANNILYAGTPSGLSFLNIDSVAGWGERSIDSDVTSLALAGEGNATLWVGTADGNLFRSPDRGVTWR